MSQFYISFISYLNQKSLIDFDNWTKHFFVNYFLKILMFFVYHSSNVHPIALWVSFIISVAIFFYHHACTKLLSDIGRRCLPDNGFPMQTTTIYFKHHFQNPFWFRLVFPGERMFWKTFFSFWLKVNLRIELLT